MREFDLVQAEFNDCVQDLAQVYEDSAKLKLSIADMIRSISASTILSATVENTSVLMGRLRDYLSAVDSNYLRLQELTARHNRLSLEILASKYTK